MTFSRQSILDLTSISWILRNWELFVRNATQLIPSQRFEGLALLTSHTSHHEEDTPTQTYSFACKPEQSVFTAGFQA